MNDYTNLIERLTVSAGDQECLYSDAKNAIEALQSRVAELEAERAEREKQEPIATVGWDRNFMGVVWHGKDMPEKGVETLLYAAPPVTEQGCVTVTTDESGRAVAVTRQDDEHRILGVIWEAPVTAPPEPIVCETCQGSGKIDERLGGYNFSNPSATCPDCDGLGEIEPIHDSRVAAPVRLTDDQVERALRTNGAYESDAAYAMAKDGLLTDARAIESAALRANGFKVEE